eukprot:3284174-Rhodomonas_salina.2
MRQALRCLESTLGFGMSAQHTLHVKRPNYWDCCFCASYGARQTTLGLALWGAYIARQTTQVGWLYLRNVKRQPEERKRVLGCSGRGYIPSIRIILVRLGTAS